MFVSVFALIFMFNTYACFCVFICVLYLCLYLYLTFCIWICMVQVVEPHPCQTARRQWEPFPGLAGWLWAPFRAQLEGEFFSLAGWAGPIPGPKRAHTPKGPDWDGHGAPRWSIRGSGQHDQPSRCARQSGDTIRHNQLGITIFFWYKS